MESKCPDETAHARVESESAFCACSKTFSLGTAYMVNTNIFFHFISGMTG